MNAQALPGHLSNFLNDAYAIFDSLNLSVTALTVIGLVLTVLFLFAVREAVSWFLKIDDLKKDVKHVRHLVIDMEAEVRMLHGLLTQNLKLASDTRHVSNASPALTAQIDSTEDISANPAQATPSAKPDDTSAGKSSPRFAVTH